MRYSRGFSTLTSRRWACVIGACLALLGVAVAAVPVCSQSPNGVIYGPLDDDGYYYEFAVQANLNIRVSVSRDRPSGDAISTVMVNNPSATGTFRRVISSEKCGVMGPRHSIYSLSSGAVYSGEPDVEKFWSYRLASFNPPSKGRPADMCSSIIPAADAKDGSRTRKYPDGLRVDDINGCCDACQNDPDCQFWVFNAEQQKHHRNDDNNNNCWTLENVSSIYSNNGRISGGRLQSNADSTFISFAVSDSATFHATGSNEQDAKSLYRTQGNAYVENTAFTTPSVWTTDGYGYLAVSEKDFVEGATHEYPVSWSASSSPSSSSVGRWMRWEIGGSTRADIYIMPALSLLQSVGRLWEITGAPKLPPLYAFGFHASRWGWENDKDIDHVLSQFRTGKYPIDSFIADFEWYTAVIDYDLPVTGSPTFVDFGYNNITFPNPAAQIAHYHKTYKVRFGGIRKPRLGNTQLLAEAKAKGWLLKDSRDLNYSIPEMRQWYADTQERFIKDGVDYFWNDEGEGQFFTFQGWNTAQLDLLRRQSDPELKNRRLFTISRSYTPGLQRLGGTVVWTGDVPTTWDALSRVPGYFVNWAIAGAPYITCDIGGFRDGETFSELLNRWYQAGVFLPIMRIHSRINNKPHFPFVWPEPYASSMRKSLQLRYRFIPTMYSYAHHQYRDSKPLIAPLATWFPSSSRVYDITHQWIVGGDILVAPALSETGDVDIYLPRLMGQTEHWYLLNTAERYTANDNVMKWHADIDTLFAFAREGSIFALAPSNLTTTMEMPGGPLEVQIYCKHKHVSEFSFFEDDGISEDYSSPTGAENTIRITKITYDDATRTVSWRREQSPVKTQPHWFTQIYFTLYGCDKIVRQSPVIPLTVGGKYEFKAT